MKRQTKRHRIIATFFLLIFFPTLLPTNLSASTNGPKSPEAAGFEPVDATDMVNLITGQYSYVLPLLNVPSPEGGYPIALGYHAGIAMDQEASWAGLGWNVNPGAIDRNVNGYPDDYSKSKLNEYFWDRTHTETRYTASLGFTSLSGVSVGVGFNWGSNQALGGSVSVGVGPDLGAFGTGMNASLGTDGASIGIGVSMKGGLSYGASINTNGDVGVNVGYGNNDAGISVGYSTNGTTTIGVNGKSGSENSVSLDVSFSSSGVGISGGTTNKTGKNIDGGVGSGFFMSFNNTVSMGDYSTSSSGWMIPIVIPTPIGIFSASFGKQKFKYWMGKNINDYVTSPLYFQNGVNDLTIQVWQPEVIDEVSGATLNEGYWYEILNGRAFMDVNEVSLNNESFSDSTNVAGNNMTFPNYDNFAVNGQGISGSMSAPIYKNGALFGLNSKENNEGYSLKYTVRNEDASSNGYTKFNSKPQFEFDNEITSYLNVQSASFNNSTSNTNALNYYNAGSTDVNDKTRRKTSNYIEYFTNEEINTTSSYTVLKANGYLQPNTSGFDRSRMPKDGIGAFKVTTVDGKTYHYSLPVYNHEIITRTYGIIPNSPAESQSYFEKRQLEPFATHWLLTAVTGPDFVDNGDGLAGEGDLGYWTSFEYGKWTDAFIWKTPYKKEALIDDKDSNIKTWIRGRKQLYYLDKIKTRTHSAIFIKGVRQDAPSTQWVYSSADHVDNKQNNSVKYRFTVPEQKQLRLDRIILLKNEDSPTNKGHEIYAESPNAITHIKYNDSGEKLDEIAEYNMYDNIFDYRDNWTSYIPKAIKVIDFNYDQSLVPGDSRLTLKGVYFKGKGGVTVLPPYKFDYLNDTNTFNIDNKDGWGYNVTNSAFFSLSKITTPQGGTINISYDNTHYRSLLSSKLEFYNKNLTKFKSTAPSSNNKIILTIGSNENYPISLAQNVEINYSYKFVESFPLNVYHTKNYIGSGKITALPATLGTGLYEVTLDGSVSEIHTTATPSAVPDFYEFCTVTLNLNNTVVYTGASPHVKNLTVSDGINNFITDYKYGQNEDGVGYVSYVPYAQNVTKEVPYSSELPAPRVMYEYITMSSHKEGILPEIKTRYRFNIMKEKSLNALKFGDFYEIIKTANTPFVNTSNKEVSINSFIVKENFAALGQLLEVSTLNSKNQLLSKVYSTYYGINEIPNNAGITQESYQSYKEVDYTNTNVQDKWVINSSTRIKYPSIIKSSTEQKNGYTYTTQFNDYDLVSGISKEQVYTSSDGQSIKTKVVPAYTIPQYNPSGGYGMGSKVDNVTNKNMLSQIAAEYSYILDKGTSTWKETGVGITTWSNVWSYKDTAGETTNATTDKEKMWRKHKAYVWNGVKDSNGIFENYNSVTHDGFNWTIGVGTQPSKWKQVLETTLYSHFSSPLEMKDINNNYTSTKMDSKNSKVVAVGNARYGEIFYTGGENRDGYQLEQGILLNSGYQQSNSYYHTGKYSIMTSSTLPFMVSMKNSEHRAGKYKLSVWVKTNSASNATLNLNGSAITFITDYVSAGGWQLKTAYLDLPSTACTISLKSSDNTAVYYDDLMIRPVASSIIGYVYNEWNELSYVIGNNGLATKFEYDAAGRLIKTYSEFINTDNLGGGFKLIKTNSYYNHFL